MCEQWSEWGDCSTDVPCTQGIRSRERECPGMSPIENEPCVTNCTIPSKYLRYLENNQTFYYKSKVTHIFFVTQKF